MDKNALWPGILADLELNLSPGNFATWIKPLSCLALNRVRPKKQLLLLGCPSVFHKHQVGERYIGQIQTAAEKLLKNKCEVALEIHQKPAAANLNGGGGSQDDLFSLDTKKLGREAYQQAVIKSGLVFGMTFDNFAVSTSNEVAHAAARTAAKKPGEIYPLVFIYGGVGVGKTHLMQAVGHNVLIKNPHASVVFCTGEEFTNEIIEAIKNKTTPSFRQKYRQARVLLLDDVQFIAGKSGIQEEFFHTFNAVQKNGGQVVLTSDRQPSDIEGLEPRLLSRFEAGLSVDIQPAGFELRTAILLIKAGLKKIDLPMRVAQVIAANVESTRKLEGVLMKLNSEVTLRKEPITEELAMALLNKFNGEAEALKTRINPRQVVTRVADYFQIKPSALYGDRRLKTIAMARQITMYLLRKELQLPLNEVGRILGGRDHSTILHGQEKIARLLPQSEKLRFDVTAIRKALYVDKSR
ncbi:chromosomal replication initiator protein DnaA [Patescibacteria group bacterium]|nr:chromosomal replication initiator protein DnaA [Patescibacteria group bacterium]